MDSQSRVSRVESHHMANYAKSVLRRGCVYEGVRLFPEGEASFKDNSSASKISGCYDYARKGIQCEIARLHDLVKEPDNRIYFPEDAISFRRGYSPTRI